MNQSEASDEQYRLHCAEVFFKMAYAINASDPERPRFNYYNEWAWGKHKLKKNELKLTADEETLAIQVMHHVANHLLAMQIDASLERAYGSDRFKSSDNDIRQSACIARLIRNAFAHDPLDPRWKIDRGCKETTLAAGNVIQLDVKHVKGKRVERSHYGGPLALLLFSKFVRQHLLCLQEE